MSYFKTLSLVWAVFFFNFFLKGQEFYESSSFPVSNFLNEAWYEKNKKTYNINKIHPSIAPDQKNILNISSKSLTFYNTGFTNIDNNAELISSKYLSTYLNYSFSLYSNFFYLKFSPLLKYYNNINLLNSELEGTFNYLNDKREENYLNNKNFIRQSTFAMHFKDFALGVSNESMWVGPGFHSSLSLSNNSPGFKYYFIGTLKQKRILNYGFDFKYFISKRHNNQNHFYHTSLASALTYYGSPSITIGFNRTYLSGGLEDIAWSMSDAASLVLEPLFGRDKKDTEFGAESNENPNFWDPWDQLLIGFINIYFPESKTHLYLELGTDDHRANFTDLKAHWDHSSGYIFGIKKFGILGNESLFMGIEIMSNKNTSNTLNPNFYRGDWNVPNFYTDSQYLFSSNEGRRWAAHSGSDSDDKIIAAGLIFNKKSIIISYNNERHGIISKEFPEVKNEFIIRYSRKISYHTIFFHLESESIYNYNFKQDFNSNQSNVFGLGFNYNFKSKN